MSMRRTERSLEPDGAVALCSRRLRSNRIRRSPNEPHGFRLTAGYRWKRERWYAGRRRTLSRDSKHTSIAVPADAIITQAATRGSWVGATHTAWEKWQTPALALADQAVVSGASFLTTVLI